MRLVAAIGAGVIGALIAAGAVSFMKYVGETPDPTFKGYCKKVCKKISKCDKCNGCDDFMVADVDDVTEE